MNIPSTSDLTIGEAAAMLSVSVKTIRRLIATGRLPVLRHNKRVVRVPFDALQQYRQNLFGR